MHLRRATFAAAAVAAALLGPALTGHAPAQAQLDIVNVIPCAQEGEICRMPHPTNVYYGVKGRTNGRPFPQGGDIACNTESFGDPAPGVQKMCWYAPKMAEGRRGGEPYRRDEDETGYRGRDRDRGSDEYRPRNRSYDDDDRPRRRSYDDDYRPRSRSYDDDDRPRSRSSDEDDRPRRRYSDEDDRPRRD